jgi:TP901 family phage tail tape measure protein
MSEGGETGSGPIDIPVTSSGAEGVDRIVTAIDRLYESLQALGTVSGLTKLEQQVQLMQASMTTGFAEVAALVQKGGNEVVAAREKTEEQIAIVNEKARDRQLNADRTFLAAQEAMNTRQLQVDVTFAQEQEKLAAQRVALEQRRDTELHALRAKAAADYTAWWDHMISIEQSRDVELNRMRQAANTEYVSWWERAIAEQVAIEQKRDVEMHALRQREFQDYVSFWDRTLAEQEAKQARQLQLARDQQYALYQIEQRKLADAEAAAERQRVLNTNFMTAGPAAQIRQAVQAQTYLQQPGATRAGAVERYGSVAVASDVDALRAAHAALTPAVHGSTAATTDHNHAMAEAHSLARGLAGSLGGLWLTYGSLVPLAAGAAIAGSLKQVVSVGSEVEHQLTNVLALTSSGVNLDQFLHVSEGSLHSLAEGANAMRMLAQNGLNATQSLQVLPAILDLATVGEMTVGQAALAATGAASAFGLGYAEAGRVADIFAKTAANSNTSVLAMTESMKQASTVASLFHVSIEETAGMLGLLAKINVTGGAAGTSLTNMLTGLYEPTEKGKRALKELGLETQTASGQLKPLTQLLEEAKSKLSGFNDAARVDILGSIFTVRGVKSAELALTNLDDFKKKTEEAASATGFMSTVVKKLEDDTAGGFQRLGVTVQNSFVRAFAEASPYVQHIALSLTDAFKDGGAASTGLQNFATNVARLTSGLVDNLGTVTLLGVGYVGLRALAPVIELVKAATAASWALGAAQAAEVAAMGAVTTANIAGAASSELVTVAAASQVAATEAATVAAAAWEAALLPILGALGIAVGVAAGAWLLFRDNTDEADKANQKIANSLHVIEEALDREIKQLEKANALWDAKNGKYLAPETVTPETLDAARKQVTALEAEARKRGVTLNELRSGPEASFDAGTGVVSAASSYADLRDKILEADENLRKLEATQKRVETVLDPAKAVKGVHDATAQLREELEKFAKEGTAVNSKGEFYQQNAAVRVVDLRANDLKAQLLAPNLIKADVEAEKARIDALRTDLRQLQDERNSLLSPRAPKVDKKAANDEYREALTMLDDELLKVQKQAQTTGRDIASAYKTGAISALQAAKDERDAQVGSLEAAIDIAQKKQALAAGREYGRNDIAKAKKDETAARAGITEADAKLARDYDEILKKSAEQTTQFRIEQARKEGDTVLAYQLAHAVEIAQIDKGLADARAQLNASAEQGDAKTFTRAVQLVAAFEEAKRRSDDAITAAVNADAIAKSEKEFGALFATMSAGLAALKAQSGPDVGVPAMFAAAKEQAALYAANLPQLVAKQRELANLVKNGRPEDQKKAANDLSQIEAAAERARNVWVDVSKSIGKGLSDAFGQGGKALGELLTVSLQYGARQQEIAETLAKAGDDPVAKQKAAADTASAQVHAYGNMAQAAAGFFDKQSKGYATLTAVSQAYHAAELAATVAELVPKAISAVLTQGEGDPYTAFGRMAAMTALVAGLGVSLSGGGGADTTAVDRQKAQGTGSVLGAPDTKSTSIARAIQISASNSNITLDYTMAMAASLRNIESNIGSFASLLVRSTGVTGATAPDFTSFSGKGVGMVGAVGGAIAGAATTAMLTTFTALGGPLGTVVGAIVGAALGHGFLGKALSSVFGGSQSVTDSGLFMPAMYLQNINTNGAYPMSYTDTKTDGGWFRGDSHDTVRTALDAATRNQFTLVIESLADGVTEASKLLGICNDEFIQHLNTFVIDIGNISLKGLSGDEIQKALESVFSKVGDDMASFAVPAISQFQKVGEGALETLTRVASDYANLNGILQSIGMTFGATGLASIAAREHLIDLAGGIDKLASQTSGFAQNFLTKGEQLAPVARYVDEQLKNLGLSGITTRDAFKQVVLGLDLTVPAQQQMYVTLMALQDAFAKTHAAAKDLTKTEQEIADERDALQDQLNQLTKSEAELTALERAKLDVSNRALFDQVQAAKAVKDARDDLNNAYDAEKKSIEDLSTRMGKLSSDWKKLMVDLKLGDKSPLTPMQKYAAARDEFSKTLAAAKAGDQDAQSNYQSVVNAFLEASRTIYASSAGYTNDFNMVIGATADAATWAEQQVDVAKASLDALNAQVSGLVEVKKEVLSVHDAIVALGAAITKSGGDGDAATAGSQTAAIQALYQGMLGRQADAGGLAYWQQVLRGGSSVGDVAQTISRSEEYQSAHGGQGIDALYQSLLGRHVDTDGLAYWQQQMGAGESLSEIAQNLMHSEEYLAHMSGGLYTAANGAVHASQTVTVADGPTQAQVARMIELLEGLRGDQQQQATDQIDATMTAAERTAAALAEGLAEGAAATAYNARNTEALQ